MGRDAQHRGARGTQRGVGVLREPAQPVLGAREEGGASGEEIVAELEGRIIVLLEQDLAEQAGDVEAVSTRPSQPSSMSNTRRRSREASSSRNRPVRAASEGARGASRRVRDQIASFAA